MGVLQQQRQDAHQGRKSETESEAERQVDSLDKPRDKLVAEYEKKLDTQRKLQGYLKRGAKSIETKLKACLCKLEESQEECEKQAKRIKEQANHMEELVRENNAMQVQNSLLTVENKALKSDIYDVAKALKDSEFVPRLNFDLCGVVKEETQAVIGFLEKKCADITSIGREQETELGRHLSSLEESKRVALEGLEAMVEDSKAGHAILKDELGSKAKALRNLKLEYRETAESTDRKLQQWKAEVEATRAEILPRDQQIKKQRVMLEILSKKVQSYEAKIETVEAPKREAERNRLKAHEEFHAILCSLEDSTLSTRSSAISKDEEVAIEEQSKSLARVLHREGYHPTNRTARMAAELKAFLTALQEANILRELRLKSKLDASNAANEQLTKELAAQKKAEAATRQETKELIETFERQCESLREFKGITKMESALSQKNDIVIGLESELSSESQKVANLKAKMRDNAALVSEKMQYKDDMFSLCMKNLASAMEDLLQVYEHRLATTQKKSSERAHEIAKLGEIVKKLKSSPVGVIDSSSLQELHRDTPIGQESVDTKDDKDRGCSSDESGRARRVKFSPQDEDDLSVSSAGTDFSSLSYSSTPSDAADGMDEQMSWVEQVVYSFENIIFYE